MYYEVFPHLKGSETGGSGNGRVKIEIGKARDANASQADKGKETPSETFRMIVGH